MARQKKTTARRGRPPKNADAPKRKYTRRKVRDTAEGRIVGLAGMLGAPSAVALAQQDRQQAIYVALQAAHGPISPRALVQAAEIIRTYLVNGAADNAPEGVEPVQTPESGPIGSGGVLTPRVDGDGPFEGDTAGESTLAAAAE